MFYKKFTKNINKLLFTVKKLEKYNILVRKCWRILLYFLQTVALCDVKFCQKEGKG